MKILIIAPQNPYPPADGGKKGLLYPLMGLKELGYSIGLFLLHNNEPTYADSLSYFKEQGVELFPFKLNIEDSGYKAIRNVGQVQPFKMAKKYSRKSLKFLRKATKEFKPDIIQAQHSHMAEYAIELKKKFGIPIVLREHNVEYKLVEQFYMSATNPLIKKFAYWQYLKTKKYETRIWNDFSKVIFISLVDEQVAKENCPGVRSAIVQDGIEIKETNSKDFHKESRSIIFTGNMKTVQNLHSITWFIEKVWPLIIKAEPEVKLYITGGDEHLLYKKLRTNLKALNGQRIYPLGFVDDIDGTIFRCEVFISPTQMGSGIRLKVLNAMALAMPIVCTSFDAKTMIDAKNNEHFLIADNAETFLKSILHLFNNKKRAEELGSNAKQFVRENFTWQKCAKGLSDIYEEILAN